MGEHTTVTCDQCEHDLTYTTNCEDWYLILGYQGKSYGRGGDAVTSMAIEPPVDREYTFCGIGCLSAWLTANKPHANAEYERLMKHREWLATHG